MFGQLIKIYCLAILIELNVYFLLINNHVFLTNKYLMIIFEWLSLIRKRSDIMEIWDREVK